MPTSRWTEWGLPEPQPRQGWTLERLTPPSVLFGSNGISFGPDGRLYVAQAFANRVSAVDVETAVAETILPVGSPVGGPDDLAFDSTGTMFITDVWGGRVWRRTPDGELTVAHPALPAANGITVHQDRVLVSEFRPGGRIVELAPDGGEHRVLLEGMDFLNAMQVGPDGLLYFPSVMAGEVWRMSLGGGEPEKVLDGLHRPTAVKFDAGGRLVVVCNGDGKIVSADPTDPRPELLHQATPGLDNITSNAEGRLFFSSAVYGDLTELLPDGTERRFSPRGFTWPHSVTVRHGAVLASDGTSIAEVAGGTATRIAFSGMPTYPGFVRAVAAAPDGRLLVTTLHGAVSLYDTGSGANTPLASGLVDPTGIAPVSDGCVVAETGAGRVLRVAAGGEVTALAEGLSAPTGVAVSPSGRIFATETGAGRVLELADGSATVIVEGLGAPQGVCCDDEQLFVLDVRRHELLRIDLADGSHDVVAGELPVGLPEPVADRAPDEGQAMMTHAVKTFAGLALTADAVVVVAASGEGAVIALRPPG